jgi:membrane-bound acyltransferase YfiQ involved in biofilm formation
VDASLWALAWLLQTGASVSFGIYLVGIILVIAGFVYAAALLNLPTHWIVVAALVMLGIGVVTAVKSTRQRDPAK